MGCGGKVDTLRKIRESALELLNEFLYKSLRHLSGRRLGFGVWSLF